MKKHNKKAFTLVELLVVIAIIAILAVVSVVGYTAFTKKAKESVAQQELAQFVNLLIAEDMDADAKFSLTATGLVYTSSTEIKEGTDADNAAVRGWLDEDFAEDLAALKGEFTAKGTSTGSESNWSVTITEITYTAKDGGTSTYNFVSKSYS